MKYTVKQSEAAPFEMGPYTLEDIKAKLISGALGRDYLVKQDNEKQWSTITALLDSHPPKKPVLTQGAASETRTGAANQTRSTGSPLFSGQAARRYVDAYSHARAT